MLQLVYPACAGIDPVSLNTAKLPTSLPRMRGDRPSHLAGIIGLSQFTPHARGSTLLLAGGTSRQEVYPACAGIDLLLGQSRGRTRSLPRMRGDRPKHVYFLG